MIRRSQRSHPRSSKSLETDLKVHERLASRRLWFFRLLVASGLALLGSLVLWIIRVPLEGHLLGLGLCFLVGLFFQRKLNAWALTWIRERVGFSYDTALEHQADNPDQDSYGFNEHLRERAREQLKRLELPSYQAWWLPVLAVAFGLAFLPLIPALSSPQPSTFNLQPSTQTPPPTPANQPQNANEPNQPQSQPANEPATNGDTASPPSEDTPSSSIEGNANSSTRDANDNSQTADEEALGRFLENLREQPQSEMPDTDLSSVMPRGSNGQADDSQEPGHPRDAQRNPFDPVEEDEGSERQEQNSGQPSSDEQTGQDNQEGAGQDSNQQAGQENSPGEQNQQGEQTQQGQQAEGEGTGNNNGQAGAEQRLEQGEAGEGAGYLPSAPTPNADEQLGTSQQDPEFLPGRVQGGANNIAGTVRLPGETSQTVFPQGSAPSSFSRAEEEALTEGRIPLEYQEIIRNYFQGQ